MQQTPPPTALQPLVQCLVHPHHPLHAGAVGAVGLHSQAHVAPPAARPPTDADEQRHAGAGAHSEQLRNSRPRKPCGACGARRGRAACAVAAPRSAAPMPPCSSHSRRPPPARSGRQAEQSPEQQSREHLFPCSDLARALGRGYSTVPGHHAGARWPATPPCRGITRAHGGGGYSTGALAGARCTRSARHRLRPSPCRGARGRGARAARRAGAYRGRVARSTCPPRSVRYHSLEEPMIWPSPMLCTNCNRSRRVNSFEICP